MPRIAFDTNLLVYADAGDRSESDGDKWLMVLDRIAQHLADGDDMVVAAQTLVELHDVLCRKRRLSRQEAAARVQNWRETMVVAPTTETVLDAALALSSAHRLRIFDAVILAAAAEAGCHQLLTEDMHNGFVWRGVEVVNPFA